VSSPPRKPPEPPPAPPAVPSRTASGRAGEDAAARYLEALGWEILARSFRCRGGEVDIVALKGGELAFVEVKVVDAWGLASLERSVGAAKRARIVESSKYFLAAHREYRGAGIRYDVVAVRAAAVVFHAEHAFSERE